LWGKFWDDLQKVFWYLLSVQNSVVIASVVLIVKSLNILRIWLKNAPFRNVLGKNKLQLTGKQRNLSREKAYMK